jgi:hypothetical protein
MNKAILVVIVLIILFGGGYYLMRQNIAMENGSNTQTNNSVVVPSVTMTPSKVLFANTTDASVASKIFPGILSADAKKAIMNFDMKTTTQTNGDTLITLTPKDNDSEVQNYTIKSGESLYFVEKFGGDDTASNDSNLKDDYGVVVDTSGYIVS